MQPDFEISVQAGQVVSDWHRGIPQSHLSQEVFVPHLPKKVILRVGHPNSAILVTYCLCFSQCCASTEELSGSDAPFAVQIAVARAQAERLEWANALLRERLGLAHKNNVALNQRLEESLATMNKSYTRAARSV